MNLKEHFEGKKIMVVGDFMLDRYIYGDVDRISPEAPIPILKKSMIHYNHGGAANVCENIYQLGATPVPVGIVPDDENGIILRKLMGGYENLKTTSLIVNVIGRNSITTLKTRYVAQGQQLLRVDDEVTEPITSIHFKSIIDQYLPLCHAVIISDYGKGVITRSLAKHIISESNMYKNEPKPVLIDPNPNFTSIKDLDIYKNATLLKPNLKELMRYTNTSSFREWEQIGVRSKDIISDLNINYILTTCGEQGMILTSMFKTTRIEANKVPVFDVSGAGDTVIATMALCMAAQLPIQDAAYVANKAASIVVKKEGTRPITIRELQEMI